MTKFKPGEEVTVAAWVDQAESGDITLTFPRNPHHPDGPGVAAEIPVADLIARHITREPAAYTDPISDLGTGARLRVVVEGVTTGTPGFPDLRDDQGRILLAGAQLAEAIREGRVTLVKAAAPQYQPGRIYHSNSARSNFLRVDSEDGEYWMAFNDDGELVLWGETQPNDLVQCDVVPAQVSS